MRTTLLALFLASCTYRTTLVEQPMPDMAGDSTTALATPDAASLPDAASSSDAAHAVAPAPSDFSTVSPPDLALLPIGAPCTVASQCAPQPTQNGEAVPTCTNNRCQVVAVITCADGTVVECVYNTPSDTCTACMGHS